MTGKIILVGYQKGGVGKTTTAINIATSIAKEHYEGRTDRILLIDADKQATLYRWAQRRQENEKYNAFNCIRLEGKVHPQILRESEKYDWIIVDVAGRDTREMRSAMLVADLVLSPLEASVASLELLEEMAELVTDCKDYNDKLKVLMFLNMTATNSHREAKDSRKLLSEYPEFNVLQMSLPVRIIHRDIIGKGIGACEGDDSKARGEVSCLLAEVMKWS